MKLAIFGGTGKTGQHVVEQALAAGHEIKALARTPSKFTIQHDQLQVIQGDVLDRDCVMETVEGTDAVISTLAPPNNQPDSIISQGMEHILAAMNAHGVERIVATAGAGCRDPQDNPKFVDRVFGFLLGVISKNVVEDMNRAVAKIRASDMDWTVVRAPMLTDQPSQKNLTVGYVGDITPRLARPDFAAFLLQQLTDDTWVRKAPAISN